MNPGQIHHEQPECTQAAPPVRFPAHLLWAKLLLAELVPFQMLTVQVKQKHVAHFLVTAWVICKRSGELTAVAN